MNALDPQQALELEFQSNRATLKEQFQGPYVFFVDLGSVLTMDLDDTITKARHNLENISRIARSHWHWAFAERPIYEPAANGKSTLPNGQNANTLDYRRELWINFASGDDAMLSRITLMDLKGARHADSGGLFIES